MSRIVAAACLLAAALAGCGPASVSKNTKDFSGAEKPIAQAVDDLSKASSKSDEQAICSSLLARSLVRRIEAGHTRCTSAISDQLDAAGDSKLDVRAIKVAGSTATATVVTTFGGHDARRTLTLVREDGSWRFSGVR